jgi:hypothetical protein
MDLVASPSVMDWLTICVAIYAAVVATGALALEVRRWFESGPQLSIQIMQNMQSFNLTSLNPTDNYLLANVINRGNAPTTITHFILVDYGTWFMRIRSKEGWTAIVKPGVSGTLPHTLQPGEIWTGMARQNAELEQRIAGGWLHVVIFASHSDKPFVQRVRRRVEVLKDAKEAD